MKHFFISGLLFLFFFVGAFYIYYSIKYPDPYDKAHLFKYYPPELILKLGGHLFLPEDRSQHFLNFLPEKKQKVLRVGAFGDSHTFGFEVGKEASYPYQLQELFDKKFPHLSIEVLNFGISGTSFQEQFFLWKRYARKYQLDYILLGPKGFFPERDTVFTRVWHDSSYPKNRLILDTNDKLKEIHIEGQTLEERYKNYYRLIPSWTALRYDKRPFKIWKFMFPFFSMEINNPFYYKRLSDEEESSQINKKLLEEINTQHNKRMLFLTDHEPFFKSYQPMGKLYNLNWVDFEKMRFYTTFEHESSLGNELLAKIYFNGLIGNKDFSLKLVKCYFKPKQTSPAKFNSPLNPGDKAGLSVEKHENPTPFIFDYVNSIKILRGSTALFELMHNAPGHRYTDSSYLKYKIPNTKSFMGFFNESDFLGSPYVSLPISLKEGMKIYMKLQDGTQVKLGPIKPLDNLNKFFNFDSVKVINSVDLSFTHRRVYFVLEDLKNKYHSFKSKPKELFVEDYKLGRLELDSTQGPDHLKFIPSQGYNQSFLMMGASCCVREEDFPDKFSLHIQYQTTSGKTFKSLIPDWSCRKEKQPIHLNLPNFEPLSAKL